MLVSRVRETADHSGERALAVDVVFNPWVLRCSSHEHHFRSQVRDCNNNKRFVAFFLCFGVFRSQTRQLFVYAILGAKLHLDGSR